MTPTELYEFYRNDVAEGTYGPFIPHVCLLMIALPFIASFRNILFKSPKTSRAYNIVYYDVQKASNNPFIQDIHQIVMSDHDDPENHFVSPVRNESQWSRLVYYVESFTDGPLYLVSNGSRAQELSMRVLLRTLLDPSVFDNIRFVDVKMLYQYTQYHYHSTSLTFAKAVTSSHKLEDILNELNVTKKHSNVKTYQSLVEAMSIADQMNTVYKALYTH